MNRVRREKGLRLLKTDHMRYFLYIYIFIIIALYLNQDPEHGKGQFTEKRIYIGSKLPYWIRKMVPKIFYVTEKAWNYYPFTITEYSVGSY